MAISIILQKGAINRYKLAVLLGLNPRSYGTFHTYLREAYDNIVQYNSESKLWSKVIPVEKPVIEEDDYDSDEMEKVKDESMSNV